MPQTPEQQARNWAMFCHLSALIGFFVVPVLGLILGPLIVWLLKKNEFSLVDEQGKEALNFQLSMLIYLVLSCGLLVLLAWPLWCCLFAVIAAVKTSNGENYRYPLTIRLIK